MGKIIFLVGEIVVSCDNLGAETASVCLSTETKIMCFHFFVDEIPGTWRARSAPKNGQLGARTRDPAHKTNVLTTRPQLHKPNYFVLYNRNFMIF